MNTKATRCYLADRDGGWICHYCSKKLIPEDEPKDRYYNRTIEGFLTPKDGWEPAEIDHIIPKSKGGKNHISNLVLSCGSCNRRKMTKSYYQFVTSEDMQ